MSTTFDPNDCCPVEGKLQRIAEAMQTREVSLAKELNTAIEKIERGFKYLSLEPFEVLCNPDRYGGEGYVVEFGLRVQNVPVDGGGDWHAANGVGQEIDYTVTAARSGLAGPVHVLSGLAFQNTEHGGLSMLCLSQKKNRKFIIRHAGEECTITVLGTLKGGVVRLGFEGPLSFDFDRKEVRDSKDAEGRKTA